MPRIRTIKPELWRSPQVMNLNFGERLLFIGLITQADDEGRGSADHRYIKASIFPSDRRTNVTKMLLSVAGQALIELYSAADGSPLYSIRNWKRHQKIDKPRKSSFPSPNGSEESTTSKRVIHEESSRIGSYQGSDLIKEQGSGIRSARARVLEDASRAQNGNGTKRVVPPSRDLPAECRILAAAGNSAGDIVKLLAWTGITCEQVTAWLSAVPVV